MLQGYVFYLGLESYDLVTLPGFLWFWGFTFLVATTLVAIFKTENEDTGGPSDEPDLGLVQTYALLWKIVRLPLMPAMIAVLLTSKVGEVVQEQSMDPSYVSLCAVSNPFLNN